MLQYYTIVKGSLPYYFYNSDDTALFEINRKYKFPKYLFTIKNSQDLFIFEIKNILFKQTNIIYQNFKQEITLIKNNKLIVKDKIISIVDDSKVFGKYRALIIVDKQTIGEINEEEGYFPYKKYRINFNYDNDMNYYCVILFAIISVHFADGI